MRPPRVQVKGPQGYDAESHSLLTDPEPQERYEEEGGRPDLVDGNFTQDPFSLKAKETDHTPNHTRAPKQAKPEYGKHTSGSAEGEYPI